MICTKLADSGETTGWIRAVVDTFIKQNVVTTPYVVWQLVFATFIAVHTGVIFRGQPRDDSKQFARKTL